MRKLIIGDIHGEYDKLIEVLHKAEFNKYDLLYSVGDFCDRGDKNLEVLEYLMSLDNFRAVRGNHDAWLYNYLFMGYPDRIWMDYNGGYKTYNQIKDLSKEKKNEILVWLSKLKYTIYEEEFMIVHGGPYSEEIIKFLSSYEIDGRDPVCDHEGNVVWDRSYFSSAYLDSKLEPGCDLPNEEERYYLRNFKVGPINTDKDIFIGHTPVQKLTGEMKPFINERYHLINIDTGSGKGGVLTLMDMKTKEYWQA